MSKIKIGFDPTNSWDYDTFRKLCRELVSKTDDYIIYMITTENDNDVIDAITNYTGIDLNNVYLVSDNSQILSKIDDLGIQIFLTSDNDVEDSLGETCYGCLVNSIQDTYRMQPRYITELNFWINTILRNTNNAQNSC